MSTAPQLSIIVKFQVEILKGPHAGEKFAFDGSKSVFIGRGSENDICLAKDPHISRQHAEIKQLSGLFYVANLAHKNFILINGERVDTDRLGNSDRLTIGDSEILFTADLPQPGFINNTNLPVSQLPTTPASILQKTTPSLVRPVAMAANAKTANVTRVSPTPTSMAPFVAPLPRRQGAIQKDSSSRVQFYVIIAVIGLIVYWLFSGNKAKKVDPGYRNSTVIQEDLAESEKNIQQLKERIEKINEPTAQRAQENYVRGFREYRQGNFLRAMDHFQIVLSLDPANELADRYKKLARTKHDELVKFNMIQGRKYRDKRNYRLCRSNFLNALVLIQYNKQHPDFPEADKFFDECDKALKGRM